MATTWINPYRFAGGEFSISNSLMFDGSADYLNQTLGAGDQQIFTISVWLKRCDFGSSQAIISQSTSTRASLLFDTSDRLRWDDGGAVRYISNEVFRDAAAWYHVVLKHDSTASSGSRIVLYVNNKQLTKSSGTEIGASGNAVFNNAASHGLGIDIESSVNYFNGYISQFTFIDGSALNPSSFAEEDSNGVWVPVDTSTLSYSGTNSFLLDFSGDNTTTVSDQSSNSNDWTANSIVAANEVTDSPTNNFPTMNPLDGYSTNVFSNGNLTVKSANTTARSSPANMPVLTGKWYWEAQIIDVNGSYPEFGVHTIDGVNAYFSTNLGNDDQGWCYEPNQARTRHNGSTTADDAGTGVATDVVMCALDMDNGKIWWGRNGTWGNSGDPAAGTNPHYSNIPTDGTRIVPAFSGKSTGTLAWNFGSPTEATVSTGNSDGNGRGNFEYAPPSGFLALCTANMPAPDIADPSAHFQAHTYTGTGSAHDETFNGNSNLDPDLVWIKNRDTTDEHKLVDSVRGATKEINPDADNTESTDANGLDDFGVSNGFGLGSGAGGYNDSGEDFAAWAWKTNGGSTSSNTDGSITSQVSANQTAGFSIVTYTATAANATVGHGLGAIPALIIIKKLTDINEDWTVYHHKNTSAPETDHLHLNRTDATVDLNTVWNDTAPTSSVFSIGVNANVNSPSADTYVAYCFAEIPGFSSFGVWEGNNSTNGPFVHTGFSPAFLIYKNTTDSSAWVMLSDGLNNDNPHDTRLLSDGTDAEHSGTHIVDFLSNGFKVRNSNNAGNGSGDDIVYIAFAKHPFGGDGVSPATAR